MTPIAALHASGESSRVENLILTTTRLNTLVNLLATIFTILAAPYLLQIWVGSIYGLPALPIVEVLMVANAIRLVANPYSTMLIATDQQKQGIAQGAVEGLINFSCSVIGAIWIGPIGVAIGTLIGATCGLAWTALVTLRRAKEITLDRRTFVSEGVVRPLVCVLPLALFTAAMYDRPPTTGYLAALLLSCVMAYLLIDRIGKVIPARMPLR